MATEVAEQPSSGRAKREVKAVEKLTIEQKEDVELVIPKGTGTPLGEIENVEFKINKFAAQSDELKTLHRLCFGKPGAKLTIKKNLRKFCGFAGGDADVKKKAEGLKKADNKLIKKVLEVCDLPLSGTKAECTDRLLEFLSKPVSSGKKSLVEKSGEKRKASEKGTTQRKKAKPAKAEKKKRPKTAYQLYADSRRDKVKAENPGASFGEMNKIIGEKWKTISEDRKAKYMEQAAELKKEFDAKEGKAPKASPAKKSKKKAEDKEEEKEEEEEEDKDKDDDDSDEKKEEQDEEEEDEMKEEEEE